MWKALAAGVLVALVGFAVIFLVVNRLVPVIGNWSRSGTTTKPIVFLVALLAAVNLQRYLSKKRTKRR